MTAFRKKITWNHVHQIWSWYAVFINHNLKGENQKCLKQILRDTWNQVHQTWPWYAVFIKHSPVGDNNVKISKNKFWKEVQKIFLYSYFDSLVPAVFYAVKFATFQIASCATFWSNLILSLHKKWSFPLRIYSVNVTKSVVSCGFDHIYWRNS